ncbi:cytosolic sulfotransferase 15-like [Mercurialis annua]|uniref:cytosolic sulfotransferase 15-like n=1 Tax=Mercurialis annua TaxID=3986 RepID=UPI0024ACB0DD|nr:cytosolic sulfotransferase 15-like [Mercurialis annua]
MQYHSVLVASTMENPETASPTSSPFAPLIANHDLHQEIKQLLPSLPRTKGLPAVDLCLYQNFWCPVISIQPVISFQRNFQAQDQDIIIASNPKSGSTWLKSLIFSVVNRSHYTPSTTPLLTENPHALVPFFEFDVFAQNQIPDLTTVPSPRLFGTHLPYSGLSESIKKSNCSVVYICRNPFDSAVSFWHHACRLGNVQCSMEEYFEIYFKGTFWFGPFWEHVLGFWKASLENPKKVLFLKYEDLKEDIDLQLKRIAEFLGFGFSEEEVKNGVVQEIAKLCSLSNLKDLEVNKNGKYLSVYPNKNYFRTGNVGESAHYLSPSLKLHLENLMQEKLSGSGLSFKIPG